jgi:glucose-6-phosphate 1-epimerase
MDTLNSQYGISGALQFAYSGGNFPVAKIQTPWASARVALQGAQVLAWQPSAAAPVLWVSKAAVFEAGKPVRGGVPVCWPWFGAKDGASAHGFVRTRHWTVRETRLADDQSVLLCLGLSDDASTRTLWNHAFDLELQVSVGRTLTLQLITRNTGTEPFDITEALHTYFAVGDIGQTTVQGLDGTTYLDKVANLAQAQQSGPVSFSGETDRVYLNTTADCVIQDRANKRSIHVAKTGSGATVVWNPWSEREKAFADMAAGEYQQMLCVETANAGAAPITIAAGATHTLTACVSLES